MSIDWVATGSWMQAWAGFAQAGAVVVASILAANTFKSWRRQKVEERRISVAEQIISLAYKIKQAFIVVRNPLKSPSSRDQAVYTLLEAGIDIGEYPQEKQSRIIEAQIVFDRLNRYSSLWDELTSTIPLASAFFGNDVEDKLKALWDQKTAILVAAENYPEDPLNDESFSQELSNTIWENRQRLATRDDKVGQSIADAIVGLENILLPVIRLHK